MEPPTDTVFENLVAGLFYLLQLARRARIKQNQRVQVAVAGVKNVADGQLVSFRQLMDKAERRRDLGSGTTPS